MLATLLRLKQICNHPSHWLKDGEWAEAASGKFAQLRELTEPIATRQVKVLVFTQFKEATVPLAAFLASVFGRQGAVLHGQRVRRTNGVSGALASGRMIAESVDWEAHPAAQIAIAKLTAK